MFPQNVPRSLRNGVSPSHIPPPHLHANGTTSAADLDRPTPRAISERIFKIRAMAKASGTAGHFSVPSANSNASTPRKKAANGTMKKAPPKKTNGAKGGAGKRKRGGRMSDEYIYLLTHFGSTWYTNICKGNSATTPKLTVSNLTTTDLTLETTRTRRSQRSTTYARARVRI